MNEPDGAPGVVDDHQTGDLPGLHDLERLRGQILRSDHLGFAAGRLPGCEVLDRIASQVQSPQVAVGDDAQELSFAIDDRRHALALLRHLHDHPAQWCRVAHDRDRITGQHEVGHLEQGAPAEGSARVQRSIILRPEPAKLQQRQGEGVPGRQGRRRAGRRRQVHRAGLLRHAHVQDHLALTGEGGAWIAREEHDRHAEPLEERQDREYLVRLPRVRERDHHVAPGHHAEIAVNALGRMQEVRGGSGRREGRRDLASDQPRLAHAGDDHATGAAAEQRHRALETLVELRDETQDGVGLETEHPLGDLPHVGRALGAHGRTADSMACSCGRSRGRSSMRSMFGPSESGRPSGNVRSGSSCISMKSASIPNATAARASAGTYWRSPPDRSPAPPGSCTEWVASKTTGKPKARMMARPRMSTTRLWYPKEAPRSVRRIARLPTERTLSTMFFMSPGATNWPFLTFTGLPVFAAARMRSVWRHRKAGICSTSSTSAAGATSDTWWTSESTGRSSVSRTLRRIRNPSW